MDSRDVFKCLEDLENLHDTSATGAQEHTANSKLTTSTYAQRISQLKSRREELRRKLNVLEQLEEPEEEEEDGGATLANAEEELLREKLKLSCYQFVGVSSVALEGNKIVLRFETSHKNVIRESYFMELSKTETGLAIGRHDLPCFVPLSDLEEKHFKTNVQLFLMYVSDYIQAYVKRREEANQAKKVLGEISCDLSMTLPADYIEIKIGGSEWAFAFDVQITYADILKILPTQVVMSLEFDEDQSTDMELPSQDQMRKLREYFKSQPLSVAMEMVWLELRKLIGV